MSSTRIFSSPDSAYEAATQAVAGAEDAHRTMDIAALHGHAERREIAQSPASKNLMEAMLARVAQGWRLRRVVSVTSEARLQRELHLIAHLDELGQARVEIRLFVTDSVPILAPLVIGDSTAFLGAEDPRDFGAYECVMFREPDAVAFCSRYFDSLWNDDRAVRVRTQAGLREDGLVRVRDEMRVLALKSLSAIENVHPAILTHCETLYAAGAYAQAVEQSFKVVRDRLRSLTGFETGSKAFAAGLRVDGAAAPHVDDDFNQATKFLTMAIDQFRNEKAHTSDARIDDPVRAGEYLRLSSLAMRLLDNPRAKALEQQREDAIVPPEADA